MIRFSIVTPVYDPPEPVLRAMLASVTAQTFGDWEHCIVDDGSPSPHVAKVLAEAAADPRVTVTRRSGNGGIVAASNDALALARGEFVVLLDHDDTLHPQALAAVDKAINESDTPVDYLYTDEDKIDESGRHFGPFYKPDWSPDRFRTQMYTLHLSVLRRELVQQVGGFRPEFDGSQDWDLVLRVTEQARGVVHVPRILYHWRTLATSVAADATAKPYAYEAGTRAIQAHCDRVGFPARAEHDTERAGIYHLQPRLTERPRVSIVIPTRGTVRDVWAKPEVLVTHCVRSIVETSTYDDYEIVCVVDTDTPEPVVDELQAIAGDRLRLVPYDRPFNFSDKINDGAIAATGEHLLLLNDDMEVVTPDWIERLVMYSGFPGIGAVGAKLMFGDGRLQHVGVMLRHAQPGHLYRGFATDHDGYVNVVRVANNYLAVTGACLMTPREVFFQAGGLSEQFPLSFNDVDYCLKVRALGHRVVYDPDTILYHFESSSRSPDVAGWELELFARRWRHVAWADPYDNPNFHPSSIHMVPPVYLSDGSVVV